MPIFLTVAGLDLPFTYDNTLGAIYLGNIGAALVYGITSVQTYIFFNTPHARDSKILRGLVFLLWILATFFLAGSTAFVYFYGVTNYGNVASAFEPVYWTAQACVFSSGVSDITVRSILIHRIYSFTKLKWFAGLMIFVSTAVWATNMTYAILTRISGANLLLHLSKIEWAMDVSYGLAVIADISLSVALCISLIQNRKKTWKKGTRTDRIIKTLMTYSINTGALVSVFAIAQLLTAALMPYNLIFEGLFFIAPGLYVNALLATLNARKRLREHEPGKLQSIRLGQLTSQAASVLAARAKRRKDHMYTGYRLGSKPSGGRTHV